MAVYRSPEIVTHTHAMRKRGINTSTLTPKTSGVMQGGFIGPNFHINPCQAFTRISTFAQAHAHTCGCHTSFHLCFATHPISMVSFSPEANCEKLVNYSGHATVKDGNKINPVAVAVIRWGGLPGIFYILHFS